MGTPKAQWRDAVLRARRALPEQTRAAEAIQLAAHASALAVGCSLTCAYVPVGTEPGSLALLEALRAAGSTVLLPLAGAPGALNWAEFTGAENLTAARYGLLEPTSPPLGAAAITQADLVLLPALAVDRAGNRLGRGAGFYDRSLALARPQAQLVAVVRAVEVVEVLPSEAHDIAVHGALTPTGLLRLGSAL